MSASKGLESNILVYRIVNDLIFGKLIRYIDPILNNPFDKDFSRIRAKPLVNILLFGFILIVANCKVFMKVREQNLFEHMGVSRVCTDGEIDAAFEF